MRHPLAIARAALLGSAVIALATAMPVAAASTNATVNLIQLLIKQKVITKDAGEALLAQAEAEAAQARAQQAAAAPAAAPVQSANAAAAGAAGAAAATQVADLPPPAAGSIRVPYIPETVRTAMTAEIKDDIMAQAEFEGWARPNQVPSWVKMLTVYGDLRFRSQSDFYSANNATGLIDFERFNEDAPIDINANTNPTGFPLLNTQTDRNYLRIRARVGLLANINPNLSLNIRIATGSDNSPISTNQTLGGGFAKKDIWLDQASMTVTPAKWASVTLGRFTNPFLTSEMMFDDDLNLDGAVVDLNANQWTGAYNFTAGLILGAFPMGYVSNTFPTYAADKAAGGSKWMYAAQGKLGTRIDDRFDLSGSAAYYAFDNVQGQLSEPCALYNGNTQCSTDQYQPTFLRKGNTLFLMRDILPDPSSPLNYAQPQVLGLVFNYGTLELQAKGRVPINDDIGVEVQGSYVNNMAFDESALCRYNPQGLPINNIVLAPPVAGAAPNTPAADFYANPCTPETGTTTIGGVVTPYSRIASYDGGNQGWMMRALIGYTKPKAKGNWNVELGYRYLESDAFLDIMPDSDFHLGGTNAKGYLIGGRYAIFNNLVISGKWMSGNEISGPPLAIDVLQVDLTASF